MFLSPNLGWMVESNCMEGRLGAFTAEEQRNRLGLAFVHNIR